MPEPTHSLDETICRVWGEFELPTYELPSSPIQVLFELSVPNDGPVKASKILIKDKILASINEQGILMYKGNSYVELVKTSSLTPSTVVWSVTCRPLGMVKLPFPLTTATFNLSSLIS